MQNEILAIIYGVILGIILIGIYVLLIIYQIKLEQKQKEYVRNLNEHDKSVIANYKCIDVFKKKDKQK